MQVFNDREQIVTLGVIENITLMRFKDDFFCHLFDKVSIFYSITM